MSRSSGNRRAAQAMAREAWDDPEMSVTMQDAIARSEPTKGGRSCSAWLTVPTIKALAEMGLTDEERFPRLTPWGQLVREAGLAARAEAGL